jgi:hypothetical protein
MWQASVQPIEPGRVHRLSIAGGDRVLSYAEVVAAWRGDDRFCDFFSGRLAESAFAAYFFETPPVTRASMNQPFQCVLVDSPALAGVRAEPAGFATHFESAARGAEVVDFANLGGDAWLIAPCPTGPRATYPHLAAFSRLAPARQQRALWRRTGEALGRRLGARPLWLSTAGLGVYWLHLRIDTRPKYYTYAPYAAPPARVDTTRRTT